MEAVGEFSLGEEGGAGREERGGLVAPGSNLAGPLSIPRAPPALLPSCQLRGQIIRSRLPPWAT